MGKAGSVVFFFIYYYYYFRLSERQNYKDRKGGRDTHTFYPLVYIPDEARSHGSSPWMVGAQTPGPSFIAFLGI